MTKETTTHFYASVPRYESKEFPQLVSLHSRVRTLDDMSDFEIRQLERIYGAPIFRKPSTR